MDFNNTPIIDEAAVRRFIEIIHTHAAQVINCAERTGVLQLCRINPADENEVVPSRFEIGDVEAMVKVAIDDAGAGHNVYIEARTVRSELRGKRRGAINDTVWVLGFVVDSDADKDKAGNITATPTLEVETSPGNQSLLVLARSGHPGCTSETDRGSHSQEHWRRPRYRRHHPVLPRGGTPNFPSTAKRERGRLTIEPTRIVEHSGRLWNPEELLAAFPSASSRASECNARVAIGRTNGDETKLPNDLLQLIRNGVDDTEDRSAAFHSVVAQLKRRRWGVEAITSLFEKYPDGIARKYAGRVRDEVERSYGKHASNEVSAADDGSKADPDVTPHILPTIRVIAGQLPRVVSETEQALLAAGAPIFFRAGTLVRPCVEKTTAADGRTTTIANLHPFVVPSLLEWMASAALFERFSGRSRRWVVIDPPRQVAEALLARKGLWSVPRVSGVITTPTLRSDGSLLADKGYDVATGLYLSLGLDELTMPMPTREAAQTGLKLLTDLLAEFSFAEPRDRSVAISGLLTALVRGSLPTAPMYLVRAHTPGTGKSYLVDVIAAVATGRVCPVITASKSMEETEKRLGAVLLSGAAIISIDNCTRDLSGDLLCQLTERSLIKIRVLGRSEMPECECHTTVFATGNNVLFKGDMVRRGLTCNLDVLDERPELREFRHDPLRRVLADRGTYVAAALTIVRAYLAAGAPQNVVHSAATPNGRAWFAAPWSGWASPTRSRAWIRLETRTRSLVIFASCSGCGRTISTSTRRSRLGRSSSWPVRHRRPTTSIGTRSRSCC